MQEGSTQFHDAITEYNADKFSKALLNINALTWLTQKYKNLTPVELLLKKLDKPNSELQKMFDALVVFIQNSLVEYFADEYPQLLLMLNTFGREKIIPIINWCPKGQKNPLYVTLDNLVEKKVIDLKSFYPQVNYAVNELKQTFGPVKSRAKTFFTGESFSHLEPALKEAAKKKDAVALKKLLKDLPGKILWVGSHGQSLVFVFRRLPEVRDFLLANGAEITLKDLALIASYDKDSELLKTFAERYNKTRPVEEHYMVGDIELSEDESEKEEHSDSLGDDWVVIPRQN